MRRLLVFYLLSLLHSGPALAASFSAPLPGLIGVIDFTPSSGGRYASFDVGQRFTEIESVTIEVEAHVFAREFDVCGTAFDPQPCVHEVQLLGFFIRLDEQESEAPGSIFTSVKFSEDFRALEGSGVDSGVFENPFDLISWDFLLDGEGSLELFWNSALGNPDRIIENVIEPSGEILGARIIIGGSPVPEPSTGLLVAIGLLVLRTRKQRPKT